jgi:hypothetical protein
MDSWAKKEWTMRQWTVTKSVGTVAACLVTMAACELPRGGGVVGTRDPWVRPFASTSIWNMPAGSKAVLVPAQLPAAKEVLMDRVRILTAPAGTPLRSVVTPGSWTNRCSGTVDTGFKVPVDDQLVIEDATSEHTPNNITSILQPDKKTVININGVARCTPGGPVFAYVPSPAARVSDLRGDGIVGSHGGSGLSGLGGAVRKGELSGDVPLVHALDILVWSKYLAWGGDKSQCFSWPATHCDSYASASRYTGTVPQLKMGALLVLDPSLAPADVSVSTREGLRIFAALQDYGGYVTDDSAWDAHYISMVSEEADAIDWRPELTSEVNRMFQALSVVSNNGPTSIGGGGEPRKPLLGPLKPAP